MQTAARRLLDIADDLSDARLYLDEQKTASARRTAIVRADGEARAA
ncbi:hypothetical protein [Rhizobium sp. Root274]|nr:hypothetical protein [Rhizobium sp. Root274]